MRPVFFVFFFLLFSSTLYSQEKLALVIGNAAYSGENKLHNPVNDAKAIAASLKKFGFHVIYLENVTKEQIDKNLLKLTQKVKDKDVVLFYYAGHGLDIDGVNYLVGINAQNVTRSNIKQYGSSLDSIVHRLQSTNAKLNMVILDACRENAFNTGTKGLSSFTKTNDVFVVYAAQPGSYAYDGKGEHGVFTKYILQRMKTDADKDIEKFFKLVRQDVALETNYKQVPVTFSSILSDFSFKSEQTRALGVKKKPKKLFLKKHTRYIEPDMVLIHPQPFMMGSDDSSFTRPKHQVELKEDFYITTHEITFAEYDLFCKDTGYKKANDYGFGRHMQPVIGVSWYDANAYAKWLSEKTHKNYSLPTEAQWEFVAHSKTSFRFGVSDEDVVLDAYAWYDDNSDGKPHAVRLKSPNAYGVYDMLGNVAEWVLDDFVRFSSDQYKRFLEKSAPVILDTNEKVVRGGSWVSLYEDLSVTQRENYDANTKENFIGFRLVRQP